MDDEDGAGWEQQQQHHGAGWLPAAAFRNYGENRRAGGRGETGDDVPAAIADWLLRADLDERLRNGRRARNLISGKKTVRREPRSVFRRKTRAIQTNNDATLPKDAKETQSESKPGRADPIASLLSDQKLMFFASQNLLIDSPLGAAKRDSGSAGSDNATSVSEIDVIFLSSWTFPDPVDECVSRRLRRRLGNYSSSEDTPGSAKFARMDAADGCVEQLSTMGSRSPMKRRRKRSLFIKATEKSSRKSRASSRRRLVDQVPSKAQLNFQNPFTLAMGELRMHRIRLKSSCFEQPGEGEAECAQFLP